MICIRKGDARKVQALHARDSSLTNRTNALYYRVGVSEKPCNVHSQVLGTE